MRKSPLFALLFAGLAAALAFPAHAEKKEQFDVCWTIYAGWMPWEYGAAQGIVDKWAQKYGIEIKVTQLNDYVESINQYTAGAFDGCTMTNMDALTIPAAGGVDSTALIVGDYSNGNDGLLIKGEGKTLADLKGMQVNLVELSVSHYFLARALESAGMSERDVSVVNTSDADIIAAGSFPIYAAGVTHRGPYKDGPGEINVPIALDGMVIQPGDLVIGDADGLLCVPHDDVEQVLAACREKVALEQKTITNIRAGEHDTSWVDARLKAIGCDPTPR